MLDKNVRLGPDPKAGVYHRRQKECEAHRQPRHVPYSTAQGCLWAGRKLVWVGYSRASDTKLPSDAKLALPAD